MAIKLEPAIAKFSPLKQETKIYKTLSGAPGVPWIMWSGKAGDFNVMVIDLLGPSLEELFRMCNRHFSLKTVLLLADQLVSSVVSLACVLRTSFRRCIPMWRPSVEHWPARCGTTYNAGFRPGIFSLSSGHALITIPSSVGLCSILVEALVRVPSTMLSTSLPRHPGHGPKGCLTGRTSH